MINLTKVPKNLLKSLGTSLVTCNFNGTLKLDYLMSTTTMCIVLTQFCQVKELQEIGVWLQILYCTLVGTVLFPTPRLYAHSLSVVCVKEPVIKVLSPLWLDGELENNVVLNEACLFLQFDSQHLK